MKMDNNPFLFDLDANIIRNVASLSCGQKIQPDIESNLRGSKDLDKINQCLDVIKENNKFDYETVALDLENVATNLIKN